MAQSIKKKWLSESSIQKSILKYLRNECWRTKLVIANQSGAPDIICCYRGYFVAFEVKKQGGQLTRLQEAQHQRIRANMGYIFTVTSVEQVRTALDQVDKEIGEE